MLSNDTSPISSKFSSELRVALTHPSDPTYRTNNFWMLFRTDLEPTSPFCRKVEREKALWTALESFHKEIFDAARAAVMTYAMEHSKGVAKIRVEIGKVDADAELAAQFDEAKYDQARNEMNIHINPIYDAMIASGAQLTNLL